MTKVRRYSSQCLLEGRIHRPKERQKPACHASNVYELKPESASQWGTRRVVAQPSRRVYDQLHCGICEFGPFSLADDQILKRVLVRLGEIERDEGLNAALLCADLIAESFLDVVKSH